MTDTTKKTGLEYAKLSASHPSLTLFQFLKYCLDLRSNGLKKNFLRMLASYCTLESEQLRLMQLASREGSDQYTTQVKEAQLTLLDLLNTFKSCQPKFAHLVQMLPSLNTRAYSLSSTAQSSQLGDGQEMEFVFTLVKFDKENGNKLPFRN